MIDLELDAAQEAIAEAVARFCGERCPDDALKAAAGSFPAGLWRELAELGVLALATPEGDGGACEAVAALEALGRAVFPGPLAATFLATQVLPPDERAAVAAGEAVVALGTPPLLPFAPVARIFIEVDGDRAWRLETPESVDAEATLGGEPWGRVKAARAVELGAAVRGLALHDLALAAYVAAAGRRLVAAAAEHARTRVQFGRPIGDFQAVAHPLADCAMRLGAAATLARAAAFHFDRERPGARARAAAARLSASRAALDAAFTAHQVFGAGGVTLDGPAFHVSRRIQQLAAQPPAAESGRVALLEAFGL